MIQADWHFSVAPLVQMIPREDGGAVLLDLRQDRFLGLDQIGVLLWRAFAAGHTPQEAAHWLATRYQGADKSQTLADIFHFLDQMEGILLPTSLCQDRRQKEYGKKRSTSPRDLSRALLFRFSQIVATCHLSEWLEAWLLLLWVHWQLRHGHLVALANRLNALPTSQFVDEEHPIVQQLAHLVRRASAWHPFQAVCLHQNLVLGFLLRRRRLHADLVIGVSTFPFFAHAWLRSGPRNLNWKAGLGPGTSQERLGELSLIFCSAWYGVQAQQGKEGLSWEA